MHRFMLWIGSWVSLAQSLVEVVSLGLIRPSWEMPFPAWETRRNLEQVVSKFIPPATDPPTPEELLAEAISQSTKLAAQFQEALGMPEAPWPDMVAEAKALSQFKAVHQSNTAAKLDKIKAALMGYDAAKLGGDAYSAIERFI